MSPCTLYCIDFGILAGRIDCEEVLNPIKIEVDRNDIDVETVEKKQIRAVLHADQNLVVDMESKVQDPDQSALQSSILRSLNCSTEVEGE